MSHVVNLILDKILVQLTAKCQTDVLETDLSRADLVKIGLLQENRTKKNVSIGINAGDYEDPGYVDGIVTLAEFKNLGFKVPGPREIGGGELWWRRGVIRIESFFVKERLTEPEAYIAGYEVLGRVQNNVQSINLTGVVDSYGEGAIMIFSYANTYFHSGGAKDSSIFRGKVFWACLTERDC